MIMDRKHYGHCSKINVSVGDKVYKGIVIANVGSWVEAQAPSLQFMSEKGCGSMELHILITGTTVLMSKSRRRTES